MSTTDSPHTPPPPAAPHVPYTTLFRSRRPLVTTDADEKVPGEAHPGGVDPDASRDRHVDHGEGEWQAHAAIEHTRQEAVCRRVIVFGVSLEPEPLAHGLDEGRRGAPGVALGALDPRLFDERVDATQLALDVERREELRGDEERDELERG